MRVQLNPNGTATSEDTFAMLSYMMAAGSGRDELATGETSMLAIALRENNVTTDEVMKAFWRAYGDPYLPGGRIEFRHLMKYINERRKGQEEEGVVYTFDEALNWIQSKNICNSELTEHFKTIQHEGRTRWVRKVERSEPSTLRIAKP